MIRRMLRDAADRAVRNAYRCALEGIQLEYAGRSGATACHLAWLGAAIYEAQARVLGYRGRSLEEQLGRPLRPMDPVS